MPDYATMIAALGWALAALALAGLVALMVRRPLPAAPLAVQCVAIALSLTLLLSLEIDGWTDLVGRALKASLGLHAPWLAFALLGSGWRKLAIADALAKAGAWLYAGFYIAVGVSSLHNDIPLAPGLARSVILFGLVLLLVPVLAQPLPTWGRRAGAGVAALLLLAAAHPL